MPKSSAEKRNASREITFPSTQKRNQSRGSYISTLVLADCVCCGFSIFLPSAPIKGSWDQKASLPAKHESHRKLFKIFCAYLYLFGREPIYAPPKIVRIRMARPGTICTRRSPGTIGPMWRSWRWSSRSRDNQGRQKGQPAADKRFYSLHAVEVGEPAGFSSDLQAPGPAAEPPSPTGS